VDATEAIRQAYQAYYRRLVAQFYALTADLPEAQDVVQETFARVLAKPRSFLAVENPESWLRAVALNVARTRYRRQWLFTRLVHAGRIPARPESMPGLNPDRLALLAGMRRLPRSTQEVLVLHHIADLPVEEVAATLNVPVGTVKARLSRGRATLARLIDEDNRVTQPEMQEVRHA
jgi:RNA polymerase sigma-70 factor (ECF subfamily)